MHQKQKLKLRKKKNLLRTKSKLDEIKGDIYSWSMQESIDGKLFVISAPSAGGKTTIINKLIEELGERLNKVVTCTTRLKREGEVDGVDYRFLSAKDFDAYLKDDAFMEHAQVYGNRYGVLKADLVGSSNKIVSLDSKGVENFKRIGVKATYILITPPTLAVLEQRLKSRGSETNEEIAIRLAEAKRELELSDAFDSVVINDRLEEAIEQCKKIITGEIK